MIQYWTQRLDWVGQPKGEHVMIDIAREIEAVQREVGEGGIAAVGARSIRLRRDSDAPREAGWDSRTNPERSGRR